MARYYAWFHEGENSLIAACFSRWKKQFAGSNKIVGFFDLGLPGGLNDKTVLDQITQGMESADKIHEVVILPLFLEPADLPGTFLGLNEMGKALSLHAHGEAIQNFFIFPVVKTGDQVIGAAGISEWLAQVLGSSLDTPSANPARPFFLFQGKRLTLEPYGDADWLTDVEGFIYLILEIEKQGLDLFTYFPRPGDADLEIASFVSRTVTTQRYAELRNHVSVSLKEWIETQLDRDQDCRSCLPAGSAEIEKIDRLNAEFTEEDKNRESAILRQGDFGHFSNLKFSLVKSHLDDYEKTDLPAKLRDTAIESATVVEDIMLGEFENKTLKLNRLMNESPIDYLAQGQSYLIHETSTINCLLQEVEKNLENKPKDYDSLNRPYADWVTDKTNEGGVDSDLCGIVDKMKIYLKGISPRVLGGLYLLGFVLFFFSLLKASSLFPFDMPLKWGLGSSLLLACLFPWLYHRYWHAKREKEISKRIRTFCDKLRLALASATRACVQNTLNFYFNRYAKRRDISLRRDMLRLKNYLETAKRALADYKAKNLLMPSVPPPSELLGMLNGLKWETFFGDLESWDPSSVEHAIDSKIDDTVNLAIRTTDPDYRFMIDKDFKKILLKKFTFQIPEQDTKANILLPSVANRTVLQGVDPDFFISYPLENKAIILGIGKRHLSYSKQRNGLKGT
jgi:hypothetical protein